MPARKALLALVIVGLASSTAYLLFVQRRLERSVAAARAGQSVPAECVPAVVAARQHLPWPIRLAGEPSEARPETPPIARAADSDQPIAAPKGAGVRALLTRPPGETPEHYRERVVPFVRAALAAPRQELSDRLLELEDLADVTDDQRDRLELVFQDVYQEAILFGNDAIQSRRLRPERLSWSSVLSASQGLAEIVDSAEERIDEILTPPQRAMFAAEDFDWAHYLGASAPWEELAPPPAATE
jgi:hypothetical protein